ncbi:hypothetical protein BDBG_16116 [Blastomyces gilchristii SLH14081]|uniref:Uncharacterized protein n=1 Tax=Blastomyces gilchristii (strain SLH14081) TaxID=559298 RepID=A0A179UA14_BLAGS|nr:uncharacterized protein BDBG_16116 [Blastomyces gilchristii SLH14081]OAT03821.1 hypothetical protein BDBG_16116 [Blastomyces gilchristii SLH14081]
MNQIDKDNLKSLEEDFMRLYCDILLHLSTVKNSSTEFMKNPVNNAQDKDKKDKDNNNNKDKNTEFKPECRDNVARTCYHYQKIDHIQTDC